MPGCSRLELGRPRRFPRLQDDIGVAGRLLCGFEKRGWSAERLAEVAEHRSTRGAGENQGECQPNESGERRAESHS